MFKYSKAVSVNFFCKGHRVSILGFEGHISSYKCLTLLGAVKKVRSPGVGSSHRLFPEGRGLKGLVAVWAAWSGDKPF
jgi:hypothetical protein